MIRLSLANINQLTQIHYEAVRSYVKNIMRVEERKVLYSDVIVLPGFEMYERVYDEHRDTFDWLKQFLLADCNTLEYWVKNCPKKLKFLQMKKIYLSKFSKSPTDYVDKEKTYNAYTLFKGMNIKVCPYCEHEFLDIVTVNYGAQTKRTIEFDHFYPKGDEEYPGLAMCFYNLIPSCKPCNQLKMTNPVAANPYHPSIEKLTYLFPNLPIGVNMEAVVESDCKVRINPVEAMVVNESTLALEQRYDNMTSEAYRLLRTKQEFDDTKLEEVGRIGGMSVDDLRRMIFGKPRKEASGRELHTKMKYDLIGY